MDLPESLNVRIQRCYDQLSKDQKILPASQINSYIKNFREKFNTEILQGMDGESLLKVMHNTGNPDSLVYWLEYKDDEEFPTQQFGSIAGGSALKFKIYKRKETGEWMTGNPRSQHVLSLDEAIDFARKHRNELVKGCELLESLPADASPADYEKLQNQMIEFAPNVSEVAWGHKYFYLMYPDKLDDFHSPFYQRFHLIKLLQTPPDGTGRFICAYYFKELAAKSNLSINDFTQVLNELNGRPHKYWRIGTRIDGKPIWKEMQDRGCITAGWDKLGDLSSIQYSRKDKEKLRDEMASQYPDYSPQLLGRQTQQLFNFAATFSEGDIVLPSDGVKVLGIGRVSGDYFYEKGSPAPHRRPVKWLLFDEYQMPDREGLQTTVAEIKKSKNLIALEQRLLEISSSGPASPITPVPDELTKLSLEEIQGKIQSILERKRQVILYGPPGTGKTYWARKTAKALASHELYGKLYDHLDDGPKKARRWRKGTCSSLYFSSCLWVRGFPGGLSP